MTHWLSVSNTHTQPGLCVLWKMTGNGVRGGHPEQNGFNLTSSAPLLYFKENFTWSNSFKQWRLKKKKKISTRPEKRIRADKEQEGLI